MALKKIEVTYHAVETHISLAALSELYVSQMVESIILSPQRLVSIWTYPRGAQVDAGLSKDGGFIGNTIDGERWEVLRLFCESNQFKIPPVFYDSDKEGYTPDDFEALNKAFEASKKRPEWSIWAKFSDGSMETHRERVNAKSKFVHDVIFPLIRDGKLVAYGDDLIPIQIGNIEALPMLGLASTNFYIEQIAPLLKPYGFLFIDSVKGEASIPEAVDGAANEAPKVVGGDGPKTPPTSRNSITPLVKEVRKGCTLPNDLNAVWNVLINMAQQTTPPKPVRGFVPDEGIQYEGSKFFKDEGCDIYSKEALRAYINRNPL